MFAARSIESFLTALGIAIAGSVVVLTLLRLLFKRLGLLRRFALEEGMLPEKGYVSHEHIPSLIGQKGVALTMLRPAGIAQIGGERHSVVSSGMFIAPGSAVVVVAHTPGRIVVEETNEETN